ncbi:response regulator [Mucilaginibacter koreensis]
MKVLIVEDNADILDIMGYILKDDGNEVISSPDAKMVANLAEMNPDLVLMDELLPGARGSELCLKIKQNPATSHIPVILVSTIPHLDALAQKCQADGYLEKPFSIAHLSELINSYADSN